MSPQLQRLQRRLERIPREVRATVQPALDQSADELVSRQKSLAPVDDGDLRDSIRKERGEHELARTVKAGDEKAYYARWVEFGTLASPAQPYFCPAYRLLRKRITNRIKRAVSKAVREHWAR